MVAPKRKPGRKKAANTAATRAARSQETRAAEPIRETYDVNWEDPTLLTAPAARPGYAQRWVRTKLNGQDDQGNVIRKLNQGWRPRPADTLPQGAFAPTVQHGDYGNVVGTHDMLLMERPLEIHGRYAERVKEDTRNLERAVERNLGKTHEEGRGFTRPEMSVKSSVTRGRPVQVADD